MENALAILDAIRSSGRLLYYSDYCALHDAISSISFDPVLEEIKQEIRQWYWDSDKQELAKDPCVVDAMIDLFIRTLDKRKGKPLSEIENVTVDKRSENR